MKVALLTGGSDRPYAIGLLEALLEKGLSVDIVGSDEFLGAGILGDSRVRFLNLRGDTNPSVPRLEKVERTVSYYLSLAQFAATTEAKVFHVLWANRFWFVDRVAMSAVYKALGKRLVFTAHNVNERKRDGKDSAYNRFTLRLLYRLMDHIFVHTAQMKEQLIQEFAVREEKVSVIPFGINNAFPRTDVTGLDARKKLGIQQEEGVLLFFGRIAPYKGLEYAVDALRQLQGGNRRYRLLIAGRIEQGCGDYWSNVQEKISAWGLSGQVTSRIDYIPDEEVELYFKAGDVLVLPYKAIFQSGLLFLTYSFGLPVIATDIGSFRDDIVEGVTGFVCAPEEPAALAARVLEYFESDLYKNLQDKRPDIIAWGNAKYSWQDVADISCKVYAALPSRKASGRIGVDS
ncbi:glycosyltransferase family 4 protein [Thioalkalicoccus limnaeus]|uniref:Glycosyltransferase family 4 protein n=1 Tax=Thioalkalicoccus limnaeus TaxID=120681 RepID=A0ABV4BJL3_9GAMM